MKTCQCIRSSDLLNIVCIKNGAFGVLHALNLADQANKRNREEKGIRMQSKPEQFNEIQTKIKS